jgi:uncharacterized protein (DUF2252 family)
MAGLGTPLTSTAGRTRAELLATGKQLRTALPRRAHDEWQPMSRRDPVKLLRSQDAARVPELRAVRYGRMLVSPFTYYRGAALVMAHDLRSTPSTGIVVQACGDAHLMNFGAYASAERRLVFDVNDFDETHPGPWEWDVKRLAASFAVAARDEGLRDDQAREAAAEVVRWYALIMNQLVGFSTIDIHYHRLEVEEIVEILQERGDKKNLRRIAELERRARRKTSEHAARKFTETGPDGHLRIVEDPPLIVRVSDEDRADNQQFLDRYAETMPPHRAHILRQYGFVDAALKVVGVGSVGLEAYIVLMEAYADGTPLMLQIKEAVPSVLSPDGAPLYNGNCQGQRVVQGQKLMQASSDPFLGWLTEPDNDYYVRQLRDMKGSLEPEPDWSWFAGYAQLCGRALACAHARSVDPALISGYLGPEGGPFCDAVAEFSMRYADRAAQDWELLAAAAERGVVEVVLEEDR